MHRSASISSLSIKFLACKSSFCSGIPSQNSALSAICFISVSCFSTDLSIYISLVFSSSCTTPAISMIACFCWKNRMSSLNALLTSAVFSYNIRSRRTQTKSERDMRSKSSFLLSYALLTQPRKRSVRPSLSLGASLSFFVISLIFFVLLTFLMNLISASESSSS